MVEQAPKEGIIPALSRNVASAHAQMPPKFDDLFLRSQLVTQAQLAAAQADAAHTRKRLPETLIDLGFVEERAFAEWMARVSRTPLIDPLPESAAADVQHKISRAIGRELEVIPLRLDRDTLSVVMVNPLDTNAVDILQATTGLKIQPLTGVRSAVEQLANRLYPENPDAPEITILPPTPNFDLVTSDRDTLPPPPSIAPEENPIDVDFTIRYSPEGLAIAENVLPAEPEAPRSASDSTAPTDPLVAIERRLDQFARMILKVQQRIDEIEARIADSVKR